MVKGLILSLILLSGCAIPATEGHIELPVPLFKQMNGMKIEDNDYKMNNIVISYTNKWFSRDVNLDLTKGENGLQALSFHSVSDPAAAQAVSQDQNKELLAAFKAILVLGAQYLSSGAIQPPGISRNVPSAGESITLTKEELLNLIKKEDK